MTAPFGNGCIDSFKDLLNDLLMLHILTKYVIKLAKKVNFCAN